MNVYIVNGSHSHDFHVRGPLTIIDDLLLFRSRIVIPKGLQKEILQKIHNGHQGIVRCRQRISSAVWWGGQEYLLKLKTTSRSVLCVLR